MTTRHDVSVISIFLTPLQEIYGDLQVGKIPHYCDALRRFSDSTLRSAWVSVRDSYTGRYFPTIADCVSACYEADNKKKSQSFEPQETKQTDSYSMACGYMKTRNGQHALAYGWGNDVFMFVNQNGREPTETELKDMEKSLVKALNAADTVARMGNSAIKDSLQSLWVSMRKKEDDMKNRFMPRNYSQYDGA